MNGQQNYYPNYSYMGYGMPNYMQRSYMQTQQPPIQQQMPQQQMQSSAPVVSQPTVPFVYETPIQAVRFATEAEANAFIVYPNSTAVFIDESRGKIYLKTANQAGVSSIRHYGELKGDKEESTVEKEKKDSSDMDLGQFVKKDQLNGFVTMEKHNELLENYKFLEQQLRIMQNQMKGNRATTIPSTQGTDPKSVISK